MVAAGVLVWAVLKSVFALLRFLFGGASAGRPTGPADGAQGSASGPPMPWWRRLLVVAVVAGVVALTFAIAMTVAPREPSQPAKPVAAAATKKKVPVREERRPPSSLQTAGAER